MNDKRTSPGKPLTFTIEVGPIIHYGFGKKDTAAMERRTRLALDSAARHYMQVGPRSKVVRTTQREDAA